MENMINNNNGSFMRKELITPDNAETFMQTNSLDNRNIKQSRVNEYCDSMIKSKWCLNGASVVISDKGELIDGQHRMLACIKSGIPFEAYVYRGVDPETMRTIDTGKSRSDGDLITMETGYSYPNQLATAVRYAVMYNEKMFISGGKNNLKLRNILNVGEPMDDMLVRIGFPLLHESLVFCSNVRNSEKARVITPSRLAPIHHVVMDMLSKDIADAFVRKVYSFYGMRKGDPFLSFQKAILRYTEERISSATNNIDLKMLIKTWNYFVSGKSLSKVMTTKGTKNTDMPIMPTNNVNLYVDADGVLQREIIQ